MTHSFPTRRYSVLLERRARRIDDAAVRERGEGAGARIGDGIGRRRALDDEQPLADDHNIERLFDRFIAALRKFLGDAVEARPMYRAHPRRLAGRRGEDVGAQRAAARSEKRQVGKEWRSELRTRVGYDSEK